MSWMSSFAFQKISWCFAWRCSRFLFSFHDVLYRRVSGEAVSDQATRNRLASIIICLSCRSVKNSFLDLLWIIAFFLFRIIFVRFRETFSLKVRVWVSNEFNRLLINFFMVCLERQHLIVFISRGAVPARELRSRIKVIQRLEIGWPQISCLSYRSVKNSFLDLLWTIAFFLFRIIFVRFRETFSLMVRDRS